MPDLGPKDRVVMVNYRHFNTVGYLIRHFKENPQPWHLKQFMSLLELSYDEMEVLFGAFKDNEFPDMRRDHRRVKNRLAVASKVLAQWQKENCDAS